MFAYNPTPDRSAEIILEGMQSFGQSIGQGLAGLGEGYAKSVAKAQENKMTSEYLDQMASFYAQTPGPDGKTPLMSAEDLEKFSKASLGAKQGMIVPRQAQFDQMLKNSYLEQLTAGYLSRTNQQAAARNQVPANKAPTTSPLGSIDFNFVK